MKQIIPLTVLAAIFATSSAIANTAYSTPSGYVTQTLQTGFNLVGLTLHNPASVAGTISGVGANSVTDSQLVFTPNAADFFVLEITSGVNAGLVLEVPSSAISGTTITLAESVEGIVATGDSYLLRKAPTLEDIFGTTTSPLKKAVSAVNADLVWVPDGNGGYNRYFLNLAGAWRNAAGGAAENTPVIYLDGFFVQRKDPAVDLVITGEVKTGNVSVSIQSGFNLVGTMFPVGSTLQNSGLDVVLTRAVSAVNADLVWVSDGAGGYNRYFVNLSGAWRNAAGGAAPEDSLVPSAVFVQRKGAATNATLTPPAFYSNL